MSKHDDFTGKFGLATILDERLPRATRQAELATSLTAAYATGYDHCIEDIAEMVPAIREELKAALATIRSRP